MSHKKDNIYRKIEILLTMFIFGARHLRVIFLTYKFLMFSHIITQTLRPIIGAFFHTCLQPRVYTTKGWFYSRIWRNYCILWFEYLYAYELYPWSQSSLVYCKFHVNFLCFKLQEILHNLQILKFSEIYLSVFSGKSCFVIINQIEVTASNGWQLNLIMHLFLFLIFVE